MSTSTSQIFTEIQLFANGCWIWLVDMVLTKGGLDLFTCRSWKGREHLEGNSATMWEGIIVGSPSIDRESGWGVFEFDGRSEIYVGHDDVTRWNNITRWNNVTNVKQCSKCGTM